jgi:hypothetical protein
MAVFQNVITGEQRSTTAIDKVLFYLSNSDTWQLVPLPDPGP